MLTRVAIKIVGSENFIMTSVFEKYKKKRFLRLVESRCVLNFRFQTRLRFISIPEEQNRVTLSAAQYKLGLCLMENVFDCFLIISSLQVAYISFFVCLFRLDFPFYRQKNLSASWQFQAISMLGHSGLFAEFFHYWWGLCLDQAIVSNHHILSFILLFLASALRTFTKQPDTI